MHITSVVKGKQQHECCWEVYKELCTLKQILKCIPRSHKMIWRVDLREFPLTALYGITGDGLISWPVKVCALVALTECLLFLPL